jgi:hypothetical protein
MLSIFGQVKVLSFRRRMMKLSTTDERIWKYRTNTGQTLTNGSQPMSLFKTMVVSNSPAISTTYILPNTHISMKRSRSCYRLRCQYGINVSPWLEMTTDQAQAVSSLVSTRLTIRSKRLSPQNLLLSLLTCNVVITIRATGFLKTTKRVQM